MWTSFRPVGGRSIGTARAAFPAVASPKSFGTAVLATELPLVGGVAPDVVDVAPLLADGLVGGVDVDEAATLSLVDVAAGAVVATGVDDSAAVVDVAAT